MTSRNEMEEGRGGKREEHQASEWIKKNRPTILSSFSHPSSNSLHSSLSFSNYSSFIPLSSTLTRILFYSISVPRSFLSILRTIDAHVGRKKLHLQQFLFLIHELTFYPRPSSISSLKSTILETNSTLLKIVCLILLDLLEMGEPNQSLIEWASSSTSSFFS